MDVKNYFADVNWYGLLIALGGALLAFLIFHAGVAIGSHRMPQGPGHEGFRPLAGGGFTMPDSYIPRGHGAVGIITAIALPQITIAEPDGDSEVATLSTSTLIDLPSHEATTSGALQSGMHVIIFGAPGRQSGEDIDAEVVHVLPQ